MKHLTDALYAELLKMKRSKVLPGTFAGFSLAPIMGALFVIVLRDSTMAAANGALRAKAAATGFSPDWPSFLNLLGQATGVGGIIIFGFVASWIFGREFSDHTAKDLLVLPVSRSVIVAAKMIAIVIWSAALVIFILLLGLLFGALLHLPGWSTKLFAGSLFQLALITGQVILLCTPVTFVASAGRGYLAPMAFVIASVVLAQIIGALGFGAFFPWAVPAIYSKLVGAQTILTPASYILVVVTGLAGLAATLYWWKYADQTQ